MRWLRSRVRASLPAPRVQTNQSLAAGGRAPHGVIVVQHVECVAVQPNAGRGRGSGVEPRIPAGHVVIAARTAIRS